LIALLQLSLNGGADTGSVTQILKPQPLDVAGNAPVPYTLIK